MCNELEQVGLKDPVYHTNAFMLQAVIYNSKVGKNYHNLESSGPKAGKTLYFWACIPHFGTDTVEKQGSGCIICAEKAILKDVAGQKNIQEETRL